MAAKLIEGAKGTACRATRETSKDTTRFGSVQKSVSSRSLNLQGCDHSLTRFASNPASSLSLALASSLRISAFFTSKLIWTKNISRFLATKSEIFSWSRFNTFNTWVGWGHMGSLPSRAL